MRRGSSLAVALVLLWVESLRGNAQIVEISGGASTSYGAAGGAVVIHGDRTETTFGGGFVLGHLAASGSSTRAIRGGTATAGLQQLRMDLPTDVFDTTHTLFGTGAGFRLFSPAGPTLSGFAGLSSEQGGTPLFNTISTQQALLFGQWTHKLTDRCSLASTLLASRKSAAFQSFEWTHSSALRYAITAGVGGGAPYAAASIVVKEPRFNMRAAYIFAGSSFQRANDIEQPTPEPAHENISAQYGLSSAVKVSAVHEHYLVQPYLSRQTSAIDLFPDRTQLDSAAIQYQNRKMGSGLTFLHSSSEHSGASPTQHLSSGSNEAVSLSFRRDYGRLQWTENLFHTFSSQSSNTVLVNGLAATINPHIKLTENVNVTGSGTSFSHGGSLLTRFSSFEVGYQLYYLATRPDHPLQQAMIFDAQVRLPRNLSLHASSTVGENGQMRYTFQLATFFVHNAATPEPISSGGLGVSTARGRVLDQYGAPVEGAALMVGDTRIYSDSEGRFFYREKRPKSHPLRVLTDEFLAIGDYTVLSSPKEIQTSASPGDPVGIVVKHLPQAQSASNLVSGSDSNAAAGSTSAGLP